MKLGIDIDGVLAQFGEAFSLLLNRRWPNRFDPEKDPAKWDWSDLGLTKSEEHLGWSDVKLFENFWLTLNPYTANVEDLKRHRRNYPYDQIFYVTSRVPSAGMPVMHQSQAWLDKQGLLGLGTSVVEKPKDVAKTVIYSAIGVTHAIDDYLPACEQMIACLDRPWNREGRSSEVKVYKSLGEFLNAVRQ